MLSTRTTEAPAGAQPRRFVRIAGFTLTELTVTLAVVGIILSLGYPALANFVLDARLTADMNRLIGDLYYVRSEAITRSERVMACKSADGRNCVTASGWEHGWMIFNDSDGDRKPDGTEPVLRVRHALNDGVTIRFRAFGSRNYMIYRPSGITQRNGTFTFCDRRGAPSARALVIYKTGRIRRAEHKPNGDALECP